jgi:hypothetical protein
MSHLYATGHDYYFRIDDVSANTDVHRLESLIRTVRARVPKAGVVLAVSPLVHDMSKEPERDHERAFPRLLSAMSDHREHFKVGKGGDPTEAPQFDDCISASHGLVHVDHRLLAPETQELSIVASCSLLGTSIFVPPFNKWNACTERLCREHGITLVKFEEGWRHVKHNRFNRQQRLWYFHTFDVTPVELDAWLAAT